MLYPSELRAHDRTFILKHFGSQQKVSRVYIEFLCVVSSSRFLRRHACWGSTPFRTKGASVQIKPLQSILISYEQVWLPATIRICRGIVRQRQMARGAVADSEPDVAEDRPSSPDFFLRLGCEFAPPRVHGFGSRKYVIWGFTNQGLPFTPWMAPKARSDFHLDL
jgi:hypothetical protein